MADINLEFSERLRLAIQKAGISQKDLARAVGVREVSVSKYAKHGGVPEWHILVRIARSLHVSCDWLLTGQGPGPGEMDELLRETGAWDTSERGQIMGGRKLDQLREELAAKQQEEVQSEVNLKYSLLRQADALAEKNGYPGLSGMDALVRYFADKYHWTPEQTRRLTVSDLQALLQGV